MKSSKILSLGMALNLMLGPILPSWGQDRKPNQQGPTQGNTEKAARGSVSSSRKTQSKKTPGKTTPGRSTKPGGSPGVGGSAKAGVRKGGHSRQRNYRGVTVVRTRGGWYSGYGNHHNDSNAFKWLAFTAIVLKLLDNLNEQQQRKHETAQIEATTKPVGEACTWEDGNASGTVTTISESQDSSGAYCREFQQEITVAGEVEQAYGTACLQPDGAWKIVSD